MLLAVILCLAMTAGCSSGQSSNTKPSSGPSFSTGEATPIAAEELFDAFLRDKTAATKTYEGKLLLVSGEVGDVGTDPIFNAPEIVLSGGGTNEARGVDCVFRPEYEQQVLRLQKGQTVSVLGICDGYAVNVLLLHCQPVEQ